METLTKEDVYFTIAERYPVKRYLLAEESHSDGGRHLHCFFEFEEKINSKRQDLFDVYDGTNQWHPNIKIVQYGQKNEQKVLKYATKEDPAPLTNIVNKKTYGEMRDEAKTPEEYMALVNHNYPRDAALNWDRLKSYAEQNYSMEDPMSIMDYSVHEGYEVPDALRNVDMSTNKAILVVGRAGCGKTVWALSACEKPALFVTHLDGLKRLKPFHKTIIFDDMCFKHMPVQGQKFIVDREQPREIHIRYKTIIIPKGVKKIFTANEYPFINDGTEHANAIRRRLEEIYCL